MNNVDSENLTVVLVYGVWLLGLIAIAAMTGKAPIEYLMTLILVPLICHFITRSH